ncbi:MAG: hypothetical protein AB1488_06530 [Nitrospirota bacterium]
MNRKILITLILLLYPSSIFAEDRGVSFFDCKKIVFFSECKEETKKAPAPSSNMKSQISNLKSQKESLWIEPVISPDGSIRYYVPPKIVLDFLEDPTEENAKRYLEWNKEKLRKINAAQEVLNQIAVQEDVVKQTNSEK